jgi:hypothetical protein
MRYSSAEPGAAERKTPVFREAAERAVSAVLANRNYWPTRDKMDKTLRKARIGCVVDVIAPTSAA